MLTIRKFNSRYIQSSTSPDQSEDVFSISTLKMLNGSSRFCFRQVEYKFQNRVLVLGACFSKFKVGLSLSKKKFASFPSMNAL